MTRAAALAAALPLRAAAFLGMALLGVALPAPALAAADGDPALRARGEQVMRSFCLSCHGSPGGRVEDPLGPRLDPEVWGDPARAHENVGALWRVNRRMDQPFTGSDEDRRALAAWLSHRAAQNRAPAWRVAAPWIGGAAAVLVAAAVALRARRRG